MGRWHVLGSFVVVLLIAGLLAAACGRSSEPTPTATPTPGSQPKATSTPVGMNTLDGNDMGEDPFILGERIFKEAAAEGVGCSYCHGADGRGNIGPNIRGKMPGDIHFALESVDSMSFIHLNQEEIEAISTYLRWLATQP
ncbi:MAG: c-type cytochrome [Dehalococcoidia bacterium]